MVPAGEAGHVADIADDGGGDDRADPEQAGQGGAGRPHRGGELLPGLAQLGVDAAQVLEERGGELAAGRLHGARRRDRAQEPGGVSCGDRLRRRRRGPARTAPHAAGRRPGCGCGPGHGGAWTTPSAPPRDHRAGPPGRRPSAARRRRPTGRRSGRSCSRPRRPAAAPGRRAWAARPAPARRRPAAAGPAGGPGRRRPRPPRSAPARPPPTPAAAPPGPTQARTRSSPSGSSAAPIATAVCEALCGSTPIITAAIGTLLLPGRGQGPWRACLIPGPCWRSRLF